MVPAMNLMRRPGMTIEQFLAWEEKQEERYEFDGFEPVLMAGGTEEHSDIQQNIVVALGTRLRGKPCRVHGSDLKICVAGSIRYPDAFVVCSPRQRGRTVIDDPVIVLEILSEATEHTDLIEKNEEYRATPSIQKYVLLQQTHIAGIVFAREPDGRWVSHVLDGAEAVLDLSEIDVQLPLGEFYAGMDFAGRTETPSLEA
jgi:Uma2 family endonuclease